MASLQLAFRDKDDPNSGVADHVHTAEVASSDNESQQTGDTSADNESQHAEDLNSTDDDSDSDEDSDNDEDSDSYEGSSSDKDVSSGNLAQWLESLNDPCVPSVTRLPVGTDAQNLPFRVSTAGPPPLSIKLQEGKVRHKYERRQNDWFTEWAMEPDINIIRNMIRPFALFCGLPNDDIEVEFLAEGAFNKVYTVQAVNPVTGATNECIFRGAMPDFPWYRMQTEVSTIELVRHHTTIPVPKIYAFDSSMDNALRLEWMLMEKIQGQTYQDAENTKAMSFESKARVYETVADWVDQLSRITFDKMGAIYHDWDKPLSDISSYKVGPMNHEDFAYDLRLDLPITRGPFSSIRDYHRARLDFNLAEVLDPRIKERAKYWTNYDIWDDAFVNFHKIRLENPSKIRRRAEEEKYEREAKLKYMGGAVRPKPVLPADDGGHFHEIDRLYPRDSALEWFSQPYYNLPAVDAMPNYCFRLQNVIPLLFKDPPFAPHSCALHNPDIHWNNIFIDAASGAAITLIDWEKCFAAPIRTIARYPDLVDAITDLDEPSPWTSERSKHFLRVEEERLYERNLEDLRLRPVFDRRLEQLASPFLEPRDKREEGSPEKFLDERIYNMARWCIKKDEELERWEEIARARFMDL